MQRVGRVGPRFARAPRRQRVAIQRLGSRKVSLRAREPGKIHQIRSGDFVTPVPAVERERRLELSARFVRLPEGLGEQAEIVIIGRHAA